MKQELKIDLPEEMIMNVVRAKMVEALGRKEDFLDAVVKGAIEAKKDRYSSRTIFQEGLDKMIRDMATEVFKEWVDKQRSKIRQAILKRLDIDNSEFVNTVADNLVTALQKSLYVSIQMKYEG